MRKIAIALLTAGTLIFVWVLFFGGYLNGSPFVPDPLKAKDINPFITGLVVPLFTLGSTLLVIENLRISSFQHFLSIISRAT